VRNPAPTPSPQDLYLDGPHVRVAPDARVAFVWGVVQQPRSDGIPARTEFAVGNEWHFEPLFDRANGQIYAWDPTQLTIARVDARTLVVEEATFDPLVESSGGLAPGGGRRRWSGTMPIRRSGTAPGC